MITNLLRLSAGKSVATYEHAAFGQVFLVNQPALVSRVLQSPNYQRAGSLRLAIGNGLAASEGNYWKRQRQRMQPFFSRGRVLAMSPMIVEETHK